MKFSSPSHDSRQEATAVSARCLGLAGPVRVIGGVGGVGYRHGIDIGWTPGLGWRCGEARGESPG